MDQAAEVRHLETTSSSRQPLSARGPVDSHSSPIDPDDGAVHQRQCMVGLSDSVDFKQRVDRARSRSSQPSNPSPFSAANPISADQVWRKR
ncbi:hypothetical protein MTO96_004577 [Rhipicephalus appendiculatus]